MYDTTNFWIDSGNASNGNPFEVLPYLSEITERQNENKGYSCIGKAGDYTVNVFSHGISLHGSLAKYFFGDNIHTLQRSSTQQAIEKLSDNLHFDIGTAKALRLDVSTVIPTKRPPADYYSLLGQKPYFKRLQSTPNTLYYNNHQRQLILYDKTKEAKSSNMKVPDIFKNDNLLRYEMRITKRVAKQFKTDVTGATLYDEVFYYSIVQQWHNEFKTIQKLKSRDFMTGNVSSKKEAKEALFSYLLQQQGQDVISEFLNELRAERKFSSRSDYTKLKAELNKMIVAKNGNKNDLVTELETAIFDVAKYVR